MKENLEQTTAALSSLHEQHAKLEQLKEEKDSAVDKLSGRLTAWAPAGGGQGGPWLTVKLTKW